MESYTINSEEIKDLEHIHYMFELTEQKLADVCSSDLSKASMCFLLGDWYHTVKNKKHELDSIINTIKQKPYLVEKIRKVKNYIEENNLGSQPAKDLQQVIELLEKTNTNQ